MAATTTAGKKKHPSKFPSWKKLVDVGETISKLSKSNHNFPLIADFFLFYGGRARRGKSERRLR